MGITTEDEIEIVENVRNARAEKENTKWFHKNYQVRIGNLLKNTNDTVFKNNKPTIPVYVLKLYILMKSNQ